MMQIVILTVGIAIILGMLTYLVVFLSFFVVMPFGAPYVPTSDENRERIRNMLRGRKRVLELGSGDGRVMRDLAETNDVVHGFELNPILVWRSRRDLKKRGLAGRMSVFQRNFWKYDVGEYDAVCVYGITYIMERLERKLLDELSTGAVVISVGFRFPNWKPERESGTVRMYVKR